MSRPAGPDPFGTAELRRAVLTTWRTDPSRLRQDANLEEDHARGYYRDRLVVELAQNAADAASAEGAPGRLLLQLRSTGPHGPELLVANTGVPLTAEGVAALASMRASAKHTQDTVGRFGVGFAAVRSVSDDLSVSSLLSPASGDTAGVRFHLGGTVGLLTEVAEDSPALADVLRARGQDLPVLRLPFTEQSPEVPSGYVTAVRLRLRGPGEVEAVRAALDEVGDLLLLALPALAQVVVDSDRAVRVLSDVAARWRTVHDAGVLDPHLLVDRPAEDRQRTGWSLTWALPRPAAGNVPTARRHVICAPTPTDEPLTVPAVLIGTFPLDPARRRIAGGPVTDLLIGQAARLYAELAQQVARDGGDALALVPSGLPAGPWDAALHTAVREALERAAIVRDVRGEELLSPRSAAMITGPLGQDRALLRALAPLVPGLVTVPPTRAVQARSVGLELREPAEVVEGLPTAVADPARWRSLYDALEPHAAAHRETLATLPVPLSDGRVVRGARGLLVPTGAVPDLPGLRLVHRHAAHPLLLLLGAREAGAREILDQPELQQLGLAGTEGDVEVVLELAAAAVAEHGADVRLPSWLADVPLPSADGETLPAAELTISGTWAADVLDLPVLDADLAGRWSSSVWRAVGVRTDLTTMDVRDVVADPEDEEEPVEGWPDYLVHLAAELGPGAYVGDTTVVADLDAVAGHAWPAVLRRIAEHPEARTALLAPVRALSGGHDVGRHALSYTAWWLREELGAPFAPPVEDGTVAPQLPFLPAAPAAVRGLDAAVLEALGAVTDLGAMDAAGWAGYTARWPEHGVLELSHALTLWRALAHAARGGTDLPAPDVLPALDDGRAVMLPADDVVVATPMWAQVGAVLPAPPGTVEALGQALDLAAAEDVAPQAHGTQLATTPAAVAAVLPEAPAQWWECEALSVDGVEVSWWVHAGEVYSTTTAGLARGLAHAAGQWQARLAVEAVLTEPERLGELLAEAAGE